MKDYSWAMAWILVGTAYLSPQCAAEDAANLPSVMVRNSAAGVAPGPSVDVQATGSPAAAKPAENASEAPPWRPSAPSTPPTSPVGPPPLGLPDVSDARPLAPMTNSTATPSTNPSPMIGDGIPLTATPSRPASLPSEVSPTGYEEELPPGKLPLKQGVPRELSPPDSLQRTRSDTAPPAGSSIAVDLGAQAAAHAAADLLKSSLNSVAGGGIAPLSQYLERSHEVDRAAVAQAYWRMILANGRLGWARDEQQRLEQIVPGKHAVEGPILSTARGTAGARATEAEIELASAAADLGAISSFYPAADQPLAIDRPLVGPYHTYYSQIFATRPNVRAGQIDQRLPLRLRAINDWAATVHSATSAVHYAEQAHAKGEVDLRTVLACHETLRQQRHRFLDAVLQYNLDIAEYAALAAPAGTSAEKFASMLIPIKQPERLSATPTRPTSPLSADGQRPLPARDGWTARTGVASEQQVPVAANGDSLDRYNLGGEGSAGPQSKVESTVPADPFVKGGLGSRYKAQGR
ncbi:MAG: hypothetical protein IT427_18965 [Pirellulales bacterium]|nr:hypothetical protein [Pirellulales bacterium]